MTLNKNQASQKATKEAKPNPDEQRREVSCLKQKKQKCSRSILNRLEYCIIKK
jgi:hypothetical protein